MRPGTRWLAVVAVLLGTGAAVAFGDEGPLAPKALRVVTLGSGAGLSFNGTEWGALVAQEDMIDCVRPTFVRGPARIHVVAGTFVDVEAGGVIRVSWEPSVRAWSFVGVVGEATAQFPNTAVSLPQGASITLTGGGDLYRPPSGYSPSLVVPGLTGLPEVSGFRPFEDDVR